MTDNERISVEGERLRGEAGWGKSDILARLFDFLMQRTLEGRSPKEIEIAQEVFGKAADFNTAVDASVRVSVHRLRNKLDMIYAGRAGIRLTIPKGEYRIVLSLGAGEQEADLIPDISEVRNRRSFTRRMRELSPPRKILGIAMLVAILLNIAAWVLVMQRDADRNSEAPTKSVFWSPMVGNGRPILVVVGDYYIMGEADHMRNVRRLVRDFKINSPDDLDKYLIHNPELVGRLVNLDLRYVPTSAVNALADLIPIFSGELADGIRRPGVITMSELKPEMVRTSNIIYIGPLSGLGILRGPLFGASGFAVGETYDELIDRKTSKHYISDWSNIAYDQEPTRDYAYIASFPGPTSNHMAIIAGTRDAAVMQAAKIATDNMQLERLGKRTGKQHAIEALYEVRVLGNHNLASSLVLARNLRQSDLWMESDDRSAYPDQPQPP